MRIAITMAIMALPALTASPALAAEDANEILGYWYTEDDESIVEIEKVDRSYYGAIIWLKDPVYEEGDPEAGQPLRDRENPDKSKQNNPVKGLQVLKSFEYDASESEWSGGTIYDPANGRTYKCVIRFQPDPKGVDGKALHVRGYIGIPTLGRTTVWYRVPEDDLKKHTGIDSDA